MLCLIEVVKMEKVLIICHGDCDGLTSGAIALAANHGARIWITNPVRLDNDLRRVKGKEKQVIITDIAQPFQGILVIRSYRLFT